VETATDENEEAVGAPTLQPSEVWNKEDPNSEMAKTAGAQDPDPYCSIPMPITSYALSLSGSQYLEDGDACNKTQVLQIL
jgi:hypothetical protein